MQPDRIGPPEGRFYGKKKDILLIRYRPTRCRYCRKGRFDLDVSSTLSWYRRHCGVNVVTRGAGVELLLRRL